MKQVLHNIGQLATCPPHCSQGEAGLVSQAALIIEDGLIAWAGPEVSLPTTSPDTKRTDCEGKLVIPGLVDCHTHLCFGGWRGDEFALRIRGASYQQIAAAGGGIRSTVALTRAATFEELKSKAAKVLKQTLALGVTTMECKSGYGLDFDNELKQLEVYAALNQEQAIALVPTFLGAHIVPPEYTDRRGDYLALLCDRLLPEIAERGLAKYCDVFIEENAYRRDEARRVLNRAAELGLGLKVHADQLTNGGGAELAAALGATSAEHLEFISEAGIMAMSESGTVAVSLPIASLYLGQGYLPARQLIEAGVAVAVATDFNPGSSPSFHLPLAMMLACTQQAMTPDEALCGATVIAARAIGLEGRAGSLITGSRADLALIDAPDLNHWMYHFQANACRSVMKSGQWVV